uniref:ShKT domain-containing protein n=1 Tax=Bursaphelenchus xylophilus TaxID=6326 RepID=A0A1I7RM82_BURXY
MRIVSIVATLNIVFVEASVCPDAGTAAGPCFEGECNDGYTCSDGGYCCPTVERGGVQDDLSKNIFQQITFPNPFRAFSTIRYTVMTPVPFGCNDGALNCGMYMGYCRSGQYSYCMQTHCRRTCGYCFG